MESEKASVVLSKDNLLLHFFDLPAHAPLPYFRARIRIRQYTRSLTLFKREQTQPGPVSLVATCWTRRWTSVLNGQKLQRKNCLTPKIFGIASLPQMRNDWTIGS